MGLFSVKHKISRTNEKKTFHIHDAFELLLNLSEGICCRVGDGVYPLKKNTLLIFNNMDLHHLSILKPGSVSNRYVLYFQPEFISAFSSAKTDLLECFYLRPVADPCVLPLPEEKAAELVELYEELIQAEGETGARDYGGDLLVKFLLGKLLIKVNLAYREAHRITTVSPGGNRWRVYGIINFIHKNYFEDLSLDTLAKKFNINKFYLCALFKNVTGMSPARYLINCRMLKAKELLMKDYSVEEVCDLAGFNNLPHFSRSFKQHTGRSPKQYQLMMTHAAPEEAAGLSLTPPVLAPPAPPVSAPPVPPAPFHKNCKI
jgi:AraC-like DNA-binding protein